MKTLRIGIIGVGNIANGAHLGGLSKCENAKVTAICDIDEKRLQETGDKLSLDEAHRFRDYRDLIACGDVDAVEICTPNYLHVPMALDVVRAGKKLNVEKPLALSAAEAETLQKALEEKGEEAMMCFSYRFFPAVRYAKKLLESGVLGKLLGVQVEYLKDSALWPSRKLEWRFVKKYGGTGVLGDLGVHLIDMTRLLVGEFESVCARLNIVVKERELLDGSGVGPVETDDECNFLAELAGGVPACFHITRAAFGHHNTIKFDIYGREGVISFNLNNPKVLGIACPALFPDQKELHEVEVPEEFTHAAQEQFFVNFALGEKGQWFPSVKDGVACQKILDAVQLSDQEKRWVSISE